MNSLNYKVDINSNVEKTSQNRQGSFSSMANLGKQTLSKSLDYAKKYKLDEYGSNIMSSKPVTTAVKLSKNPKARVAAASVVGAGLVGNALLKGTSSNDYSLNRDTESTDINSISGINPSSTYTNNSQVALNAAYH